MANKNIEHTTLPRRGGVKTIVYIGDKVDLLPTHPNFPDGKLNCYMTIDG